MNLISYLGRTFLSDPSTSLLCGLFLVSAFELIRIFLCMVKTVVIMLKICNYCTNFSVPGFVRIYLASRLIPALRRGAY